jgi:phenylpropionate dioxygenase-like ring-hydroxylating dioxygenase large terminal subunit
MAPMSELLRDLWYFAAASSEVKRGRMFRREILGEPVAIGRDAEGRAFALRDICPHRAVPLSAGRVVANDGEQTVECPYHGFRFGTGDGVCKLIPSLAEGQTYEAHRIRVRRFPTYEANGIILAYVSSDPRFAAAPPPAPDFGLGDFIKPKFIIHRIFAANMDNAVVGLMDPAHVPYVHSQWWWRPPSVGKKLKEKRFVPRERGWAIERHKPASNSLGYRILFGNSNVSTEISFMLPGFRWEVVDTPRSRVFTLTCLTPENDASTRITQVTYWKNAPLLDLIKPILAPAGREFLDQDGRMVDLQNSGLAYKPSMLWIDDIDVQAKWYLKLKREWAKSREEEREFVNPIEPTTLKWMS